MLARKKKPQVAVVDWRPAPASNSAAKIESTVIGKAAMVMGQVGSAGHLRVGDGAFVGTRTGLHRDVPAGSRVWGSPQMEERLWHRSSAALRRLPDVLRRVRALERKLGLRRGSDSEDDG